MPFLVNYRLLSCLKRLENRNFSTQQMGMASIADTLYSHLYKNSGNIEKSLSTVNAKLDTQCVTEVINRCCPQQSLLGIRFFIWAGLQSRYKHSATMYKKACNSLSINQNPQIIFDVIHSYEAEGSLVTAKTFKEVLKLCEKAQHADVALWLLRKMAEFNLCADTTMYNVVINLCCKKGDMEMAENLIREMGVKDLYPDMITYMTMIQGFCNAGRLDNAYSMLKDMRAHGCSPNSVVYTALLDGLCRFGLMERALELWEEMKEEGGNCSPNVITYTSLIQGFSKKGQWREALHILDKMKDFGCSANHVTVSIMIDSLCAEGHVEEAYRLIDKFVGEHGVSYDDCYNSLVIALVRMKKCEEAEKLFRKMLDGGVKPDSMACSLLLKELCMKDQVLDGFCLLDEIENTGCLLTIDSDIYCILLVELCQQSHLIEATKLAKIMLKKSVVLKAPYNESAIDILRNSGEEDLVNRLIGIDKGH